ncbi:MAG: hypothetical protein K1Y36_03840 [Blastocatellia bacterium]|nr:hypothetical protein [Blastocatellia bacterium]
MDLVTRIRTQLAMFDDGAFETLSNKGLVRRARKDLQGGAAPEIVGTNETHVLLKVTDAEVKISEQGPAKAVCSCPSVELCRHILIACFWLQETRTEAPAAAVRATPEGEPPAALPPPSLDLDDTVLLQATVDVLTKLAGKKLVKSALELFSVSPEHAIHKEAGIMVDLPTVNATVRFFPGQGLEGMLCSCKAREFCSHRVLAVLLYQKAAGVVLEGAAQAPRILQETGQAPRTRNEILVATKSLLAECLHTGICHLSEATEQRLVTLSVAAVGVHLPRLSHVLRGNSDELRLLLKRDAKADEARLFSLMARTFALCQALEKTGEGLGRADLIGKYRTTYDEVGTLELCGIGAYQWETKSGFAGLTVLFWDERSQRVHSWSEARPKYQGTGFNPLQRLYQEGPWEGMLNPAQASRNRFKLMHARRNGQFRLSGSSGSRTILVGPTMPAKMNFEKLAYRSWKALAEKLATQTAIGLAEPNPLDEIVLAQPAVWGEREFDSVSQTFYWEIQDEEGLPLLLQVSYSDLEKQRITALEQLDPAALAATGVVCRAFRGLNGLRLYPISLLSEADGNQPSVINLGFSEGYQGAKPLNPEPTTDTESESLDPVEETPEIEVEPTGLFHLRLLRLNEELNRLAQRGGFLASEANQQFFRSESAFFQTAGLTVLAESLRNCGQPGTSGGKELLEAKYLALLCLEALGKTV